MSTHKYFDRLCTLVLALCLFLTLLMCNAEALGIQAAAGTLGYESRLFDTGKVHTIEIAIDDWEGFLSTAQSEVYTVCDVTIDGETLQDVGIRGKGNTSLSTVASMDSDRYSFKVEFDQYDSTKSYHGLDKLCLNNLIQDNTMMKDYLVYQMMNRFGVAAPLCSFAYITVNGEDWGLYLAVEAVEDSFLRRNYGSDYGELYKPDSMSMGGGRGNGREFDMNNFLEQSENAENTAEPRQQRPEMPQTSGALPQIPEDFDPSSLFGEDGSFQMPEDFNPSEMFGGGGNMGGGGFGGMGSSDVKLQYIDQDPDSYSSIFDSAKTAVTAADKTRLISALQALSQGDSAAVDIEATIRYFVVHNFVVNGDSYTGSMVHNYYLYEENGLLSMIPWDYNLAFGTFQGNNAASAVNDDINAPLSCSGNGDRPMMDWLLQNDQYTWLYHQYFTDFLDNMDAASLIVEAAALIAPYVEKDPTRFCTYEEFQAGVEALTRFCTLRTESVRRQLEGNTEQVDTGDLELSAMGTMNMGGGGMGGGFGGGRGNRRQQSADEIPSEGTVQNESAQTGGMPGGGREFWGQIPQMPAMSEEALQQPDSSRWASASTQPLDDAQTSDTGSFPDRGSMQFSGQAAPSFSGNSPVLLAVSAVVLALGLLAAFKYNR